MELQTFKQPTTEIVVSSKDIEVNVYNWANCEGASLHVINRQSGLLMLSASLRWEEIDVLLVGLTAARAQ